MKRTVGIEIISFLFVVLFSYAALTKLFDLEKFRVQIGQSPLLTGLGPVVSILVITTELAVVVCFAFSRFRLFAFYSAFSLMTMFTVYILFILTLSYYIPCSCGGVLEKLSWTQHLIFNGVFIVLALVGIVLQAHEDRSPSTRAVSGKTSGMRSVVLRTGMVFVLSIGIVATLYGLSSDIRKRPGSFLREFPPHPIVERGSIPIPHPSYYFAGAAGDRLYLAHRHAPLHVMSIQKDFRDTLHHSLILAGIEKLRYFRIRVVVDSPYIFFLDGAVPFLYRGTLTDMTLSNILSDSLYFTHAIPLSGSSFGLQAVQAKTNASVLAKRILHEDKPHLGHGLLEAQGSNFSADGLLHYNRTLQKLIYLYFYRNEYFVTDTTLQLHYRAHTLDTFQTVRITADTIHSQGVIALSTPPPTVNHCLTTYGRWLLVHSLIAARNENLKRFGKGSVIDVYDLDSGRYAFSFYIDSKNKNQFKDMFVVNDQLFALFDDLLVRYDLMEQYFGDNTTRY